MTYPDGGQTAERRDAEYVEHAAADDGAESIVGLLNERSDEDREQFRSGRRERHESSGSHILGQIQTWNSVTVDVAGISIFAVLNSPRHMQSTEGRK